MNRLERVLEVEREIADLEEQITSLLNQKSEAQNMKYVLQNACQHDFAKEFIREIEEFSSYEYSLPIKKPVVYCQCIHCNAVRQKNSLPTVFG